MNLPARIEQVLKFSVPLSHHQIAAALSHDPACVCGALNNMIKQGRVRIAHYERSVGKPTRYYDLNVHLPSAKPPKALTSTVKSNQHYASKKALREQSECVYPAWMR